MYEMVVGLELSDSGVYGQYRAAMKPILSGYGGGFGYDFEVSRVLLSPGDVPINRVFTIYFPSPDAADRFFTDPDYLQCKARFFDASVVNTTIIARYEKSV